MCALLAAFLHVLALASIFLCVLRQAMFLCLPSLRSAEHVPASETMMHALLAAACSACAPADTPNAETGWSPERAKAFGAAHVTAFVNTVPTLLTERGTKDEQQ
jgi:hypothetical protein